MLAASSGETRSSASRQSTQSCAACSTANCFWRPKPSHSFCTTRAPCRAAISIVPSLLAESTSTISSTNARLSRQVSRTFASFRVMTTAESGARDGAFKSYPLKSAVPILSNAKNSLRQDLFSRRCGAALPGGERCRACIPRREHRLGGGGALRRDRLDARRRAARDSGGDEALARLALAGERYEAVIDSQGLVKSALICRSAFGTKHGLDRASAREPMAARFYDVAHAVPRAMHAVERNRLLTAKALGYSLQGPVDYGLRPRHD